MANLNLKWGLHNKLPKSLTDADVGSLFFTKDEGGLYLGVESGKAPKRIQGVVQYYANLSDFKADVLPPYSSDVIYYIASENALVRWDGNPASVDENGNAIMDGKFVVLNVTASEFNTTVDQITRDMSGYGSRIETAEGNITGLRTDLGNTDDTADKATAFGRIADLEDAVAALEELTGTGSGDNSLSSRIGALETWMADAKDEISGLQSEVSGISSTVDGHTSELSDLATWKTEVDADLGEIDAALTDLVNADSTMSANIQTNTNAIATLDNTVSGLQSDVSELSTDLTAAQGDITRIDSALTVEAGKVSALQRTVSGHTETLTTYNTKIGENAGAIVAINSRLDGIDTSISGLTTEDENLRKDLGNNDKTDTTAFKRIAALEAADVTINSAANTLKGRVDVLEPVVQDHGTRVGAAETNIENLQKDLGNLQTAVEGKASSNDLNALKLRVDAHDEKFEAVDGEFTDIKADIDAINKVIGSVEGEGTSLLDEIDALKSDLSDLGTDVGNNASAIDQINKTLTTHNTNIENNAKAIEEIQGVDEAQSKDIKDIQDWEADAKDQISGLLKDVSYLGTEIEKVDGKFANYYTKTEVDGQHAELKSDLEGQLNSHINAANALKYIGGVDGDNWDEIAAADSAIGNTYIVQVSGQSLNVNGTSIVCYAGDLLIATAASDTDEVDGVLPANKIVWVHVKAGYNEELASTLSVVGNDDGSATVGLTSYVAKDTNHGDLGKFSIASESENLEVSIENNAVKFKMVWGTFGDE